MARACNCGTLKPCDFHEQVTHMVPFIESGLPVAIVQGPHRGRWGYVNASDGINVVVSFAHLAMDEDVTVRAEEVARIGFLAS